MTYLYPARLGCRVTNGSDQSIPNTGATVLTFDTSLFDVGDLHDTAINNSRITIPTNGDGVYVVGAGITFDPTAAVSQRELQIMVNGSLVICKEVVQAQVVGVLGFSLVASCTWNFVAGDFIEATALQDTLGALDVISSDAAGSGEFSPIFWAQRLSD
jgi:hypothetical protein